MSLSAKGKLWTEGNANIIWVTNEKNETKGFKGVAEFGEGISRVTVCKFSLKKSTNYEYYEPCGSLLVKPALKKMSVHLNYYGQKSISCLQGYFKVVEEEIANQEEYASTYHDIMMNRLQELNIAYHGLMHPTVKDPKLCANYPAGHGIPELEMLTGSSSVLKRSWRNAVTLARGVIDFVDKTDFFLLYKASGSLLELVGATALVLLGANYPGATELVDDRGHPSWSLYTLEDCDGKAISVVSFFHLLKRWIDFGEVGEDERDVSYHIAEHMARTFSEGCIIQCMVDVNTAKGEESCVDENGSAAGKLVGHVVGALIRHNESDDPEAILKNALIVDGTCTDVPHFGPEKWASAEEVYEEKRQGDDYYADNVNKTHIFNLKKSGIPGISGIRCAIPQAYVEMVSVYFKDRMCVTKPLETDCKVVYNVETLKYKEFTDGHAEDFDRLVHLRKGSRSLSAMLSGKLCLKEMPKANMFVYDDGNPLREVVLKTLPFASLDDLERFERDSFGYTELPKISQVPKFISLVGPQDTLAAKEGKARVAAFSQWAYVYLNEEYNDLASFSD